MEICGTWAYEENTRPLLSITTGHYYNIQREDSGSTSVSLLSFMRCFQLQETFSEF